MLSSRRWSSTLPWLSVKWIVALSLFSCGAVVGVRQALATALDAALIERIDAFVERERKASGIPGIAMAVVHVSGPLHVRGFGNDGRGSVISADTPFPIGSLTKSFTALLVRQAVDAGQLDIDAPVQRYLPWFRTADAAASQGITVRHLLNQTSGFSRADGIAPLLAGGPLSIEELVRGLANVSLNRPVGGAFEYSNLNYVLLAAVLQAATGRRWGELMQERVLQPLAMTHSHVDQAAARRDGLTAVHQIVFGVPIKRRTPWVPAFEPTGGLTASANDMARYLQMLLAGGQAPGTTASRIVSAAGVKQLLAPASPAAHATLLSADFDFRYGEGWFVGPFGSAADARWHLGSLTTFAAWMVLLPDTKQAVVMLINANSELPVGGLNAVISRLPIGVVNLLRGEQPPQGSSLRAATSRFIGVTALVLAGVALLTWRALRARRVWGGVAMAMAAVVLVFVLLAAGLRPSLLWSFAPELAVVLAATVLLLCFPFVWRFALQRRT